jgi:pyruvate dehydrogenase E1 component alpha subunit
LPHAAGLAWALKIRKVRAAVAVYLGEGASSEGDFHEAANLAAVMRVPLVFLLINNRYAISTPVKKQSAASGFSARAAGYGFPGVEVDGNDLLAVYSATTEAVQRALSGGGPSLLALNTYRLGFHNTSDNPSEYREASEVSEAASQDPVERTRRLMTEAGIWSPAREAAANQEIRDLVEEAQKLASGYPRPGPEAVFDHVYATRPRRLERQRTERVDGIE